MGSKLESALKLASMGFRVFPLIPNSKLPAIENFTERATTDETEIRNFWIDPILEIEQPYNIGIATSGYEVLNRDNLVVVDADVKPEKNGLKTLDELIWQGREFPPTAVQTTASGSKHYIFRNKDAVKQGESVLGLGLDIRSKGGYIVGDGSEIDGNEYLMFVGEGVEQCPQWIVDACGKAPESKQPRQKENAKIIDQSRAGRRATKYLLEQAPLAIEGAGGDTTTFQVIAKVRDFGVSEENAFTLLSHQWNDRCSPPWLPEDLLKKVENAYRYSSNSLGKDSVESEFPLIEDDLPTDYIDTINKDHAFIVIGDKHRILLEKGNKFHLLSEETFHKKYAAWKVLVDDKQIPASKIWISSPRRRTYDGFCFNPGLDADLNKYNIWRGFSVKPLAKNEQPTSEMKEALKMFQDHALKNVCDGDLELYDYLMCYFAHLIQRPWDKPRVALVFKGNKGVGKNVLVEAVGNLFQDNFYVTSDQRDIVGNFNSILENKIFVVLDEAFWSGDKTAEGALKSLITGRTQRIEQKGLQAYSIKSCMRLAIISNEDWVVPATGAERRFAIFNVGEGNIQDVAYFSKMVDLLENKGGNRYLFTFLQDYKITKNIDVAPATEGLHEQKTQSLKPIFEFWYDCVSRGAFIASETSEEWPDRIETDRLNQSFFSYLRSRNINSRTPTTQQLLKSLRQCCPKIEHTRYRVGGELKYGIKLPDLQTARDNWDKFIGHKTEWPIFFD